MAISPLRYLARKGYEKVQFVCRVYRLRYRGDEICGIFENYPVTSRASVLDQFDFEESERLIPGEPEHSSRGWESCSFEVARSVAIIGTVSRQVTSGCNCFSHRVSRILFVSRLAAARKLRIFTHYYACVKITMEITIVFVTRDI